MSACSREVGLQPADTDLNQKRCSSTLRQLTTNLDLAPNILVTAVMQNFTGAFCGLQNMSKCVSSRDSATDPAEELTTLPPPLLVGWGGDTPTPMQLGHLNWAFYENAY